MKTTKESCPQGVHNCWWVIFGCVVVVWGMVTKMPPACYTLIYWIPSMHPSAQRPTLLVVHPSTICLCVFLSVCLLACMSFIHPTIHLCIPYSSIHSSVTLLSLQVGQELLELWLVGCLKSVWRPCSCCFIVVKVSILHWHCMNTISVCANAQSLGRSVVMPIPGILVLSLLYDHFWDHYTYCMLAPFLQLVSSSGLCSAFQQDCKWKCCAGACEQDYL